MGPKKQQKMSLGDFLGDQSLGSWADEMEDMPLPSESRTGYGAGGPRGFGSHSSGFDRGPSGFPPREQLPLPTKPPFTAHLGNLSFDATEGDIHDFFEDCSVTSVRIVEDKLERKPKGFGYVEFGTLDGLKKALDKNGFQFQGRNIRISVAEPPKDRPEARELSDWTRKGPLPDLPANRRASDRGSYRNMDNMSDAGSERGERRRPPFEGDGKARDFGNWERKGPLSPLPTAAPPRETRIRSQDGGRERKISPSWGEGRSQDGSRPPKRDQERPQPERAPTAPEMDNQWRARMRPDPPPAKSPVATPESSLPSSPAPAIRPKLNLQKRTVSEEPAQAQSPASTDPKSNPFGGARPIDTAAREREIEEKRLQVLKEKKEQEDKAREEKKAKEAAAKAEKGTTSEQEGSKGDSKENGASSPPTGRSYEILRNMGDEDAENGGGADRPANGVVEDKAANPEENVAVPKEAEGSWRRKSSTPAEPTAETLEEEGWSTVSGNKKKSRGNPGARAIAS